MRHTRHSDGCIASALGKRYKIEPAAALASFIHWRRRLMDGEDEYVDRHCSCGLVAPKKKVKAFARSADTTEHERLT